MNLSEIENEVIKMIHNFTSVKPEKISSSEDLVKDGTIDSLTTVNLIMEIEEIFNVTVYPDEARDLITVTKIAKFIYKNL